MVQAHPSRAGMALALSARVGAEVVFDPDPEHAVLSPWRTYRRALETTPAWASHRVVLQDDVEACGRFARAACAAIDAKPDALIPFFVAGVPEEYARKVMEASWSGESWARLQVTRWVPTVALAWPVWMIEPFLDFVDRQEWPPQMTADDAIVGHYAIHAGVEVWATVPSLVEHPDVVPSIMHNGVAYAGQAPGRVAACYIGDCDPATIDWT